MTKLDGLIDSILSDMVAFRRDLHAHPEIGMEERRTSQRVIDRLSAAGNFSIQSGIAQTGVVALLNADRDGPCLALRADMDCLPMDEATGVPYASTIPGRMHACGHDGHTSCLLGTALVLSRMVDELPGKVKFIFQPGEENDGGGRMMCEAGVLANPKVDAAFALHSWPAQPVGTISMCPGAAMAGNDGFAIVVTGKGSHGAYPHLGIDPIVVAAHIVIALQTIASRSIDPQDCVVVTAGVFHGGTVRNVIPATCRLEGTLRSYKPATRERLKELVRRIAENTAESFGATAAVEFTEGYPVTVNEPALTEWVASVGREVLGADRARTDDRPSMGAEDFGFFAQRVPAVMFRLGIRQPGAPSCPALHHPQFNFNDDALGVGIRMLCELTMRFLRDKPNL
ncbi:MAG: amidohydrolase [Phycisphaerae bacterium]|nr:amidohydrolase [Phycisphaerae bacterium]